MSKRSTQPEHLSDLNPDQRNARKHNPRNIGMVVDSLHEVGPARSGVIDENNNLLVGNGTWEALAEAGIERVKVVEADGNEWVVVRRTGLTEEQKRKLAIYDNRTSELADWDPVILQEDIEGGLDLSGLWRDNELEELLGDLGGSGTEDPGADIDQAEELQKKWKTERGQIWEIGRHRLMCGDSTSAEDVGRLMDGEKAEILLTDPPYGVGVVPTGGGKIGGDVLAKNRKYAEVEGDDRPFEASHLWGMAGQQIVFGANYFPDQLPHRGQWLAWDKGRPEGTTFSDVELAWTSGNGTRVKAYRCVWHGMTREGESGERYHPTQKPVKLFAEILQDHPGDSVVDAYIGSGTTMVAAEQLERTCYGMEIDPGYTAVVLERMAGMDLEPKLAGKT